MCDSQYRFTFISLMAPGSCHDSLAFFFSSLAKRLEELGLPPGFFIVADNAYSCSDWMIVPFKNAVPGSIEDDVNFYISQVRCNIECTFGIFMRRWGLFWRPLEIGFERRSKVITLAAKLHNFIINNQSTGANIPKIKEYQNVFKEGKWVRETLSMPELSDLLTGEHKENRTDIVESGARRDAIAAAIRSAGLDVDDELVSTRDRLRDRVVAYGLQRRT